MLNLSYLILASRPLFLTKAVVARCEHAGVVVFILGAYLVSSWIIGTRARSFFTVPHF